MKTRNGIIAALTTIVVALAMDRFVNESQEKIDRDMNRLDAHTRRTSLSLRQLREAQEAMHHKLLQMIIE